MDFTLSVHTSEMLEAGNGPSPAESYSESISVRKQRYVLRAHPWLPELL